MLRSILLICILLTGLQAFAWSVIDDLKYVNAREEELNELIDSGQSENGILEEYLDVMNRKSKYVEFQLPRDQFSAYSSHYRTSYSSLSTQSPPQSLKALCRQTQNAYGVNKALANELNRMSFANNGGYFGQGTCWWHSSLTRSAGFLAVYFPNLPRPNASEVERIVDNLIAMKGVVSIPGFKDWRSFSMTYRNLIQAKLDQWQRQETFNFGWIRGTKGSAKNNARDMREQMDRAHFEMNLYGYPIYMMLQFEGPMAHAWLLLDIKKTKTGYDLWVLDSNYSSIDKWEYKWNQGHFTYAKGATFIPYITSKESTDLRSLKAVTEKFCSQTP